VSRKPSSIQRELKQTRPFASLAQEAAIALLRTADVVRRRIEAVIEAHGISVQQYNVLRILRGAGKDGLPTLEIVDRLIEQAPGITRLCDALERRGLIERSRLAEDRRVVQCRIARAGRALLTRLDEPVARADASALGWLAAKQARQLLDLLDRIREAAPPPTTATPSR
jgi:DNA-binding MarR family transcriptional regulator